MNKFIKRSVNGKLQMSVPFNNQDYSHDINNIQNTIMGAYDESKSIRTVHETMKSVELPHLDANRASTSQASQYGKNILQSALRIYNKQLPEN